MSQLPGCSFWLSQNENSEYQLTFQAQDAGVLNEIMAVVYTQLTPANGASAELKGVEKVSNLPEVPGRKPKTRFLIKDQGRYYPVHSHQIAYFYASERQVYLKTKAGVVHKLNERMDDIEQWIDASQFFRINRSVIVSYESIREITYLSDGKLLLTTNPVFGSRIFISKERLSSFKNWLNT